MIASATEIVCALGFEKDLVARSHECDFPEGVRSLPVCTRPRFDVDGSSKAIDERVKALLHEAAAIYHVDADLLRAVKPDFIVTQGQCEVCAVSDKDVDTALCGWIGARPVVVSLSPNNLEEVWASILGVADALGAHQRGIEVVEKLRRRVDAIAAKSAASPHRPRVACLEWLDPLMAAGNWVPELVQLAAGVNLFGEAGRHSPWMTWDDLVASDPDVIVAMPCGFDLPRVRAELALLDAIPAWRSLRAVREGRAHAVDGNQFFNRPGPRLVESLAILAEIFHGPATP